MQRLFPMALHLSMPDARAVRARHERLATLAAAVTVALAGLIHLVLIPEHFAERFLYGVVFTAMALFQLTLAWLLLRRPGPRVYRAGIWGSGLIVLVYV